MPRSLWNGTIKFGTVRVPVKLYSAVEPKGIRFHERHLSDGAAIQHRRVCVAEEREVPYAEIVKGYEVSAGRYVVLSKEEIAAADGQAAREIDIEHFVHAHEIDPIYYERTYHLGAGKFGEEPYRVLHAALKRSGRVGIGRFTFHNKAQLIAIRALSDVLAGHTMRFADELRPLADLDVQEPDRRPTEQELEVARALVDQLGAKFQPSRYHDTYRKSVLALIERKAGGEAIEVPPAEPATAQDDLLTKLRESLDRQVSVR